MLTPLKHLLAWAFWSWVASPWCGGGPRHHTYAYAKFAAHVARLRFNEWRQAWH